jgi:hypothetical protein
MKLADLKNSGVDQFRHENLAWGRALDFYAQENSYLKTRLSQVVDKNADKEFVVLAEHFNSSFILNDEYIEDLQKENTALKKLLKKGSESSRAGEKTLEQQQMKLRNEMGYFEKNFADLKNRFNDYLLSLVS